MSLKTASFRSQQSKMLQSTHTQSDFKTISSFSISNHNSCTSDQFQILKSWYKAKVLLQTSYTDSASVHYRFCEMAEVEEKVI